MTEFVDVVDENDNFIKTVSRKESHEKWLLHRVVHVLIFNSAGQMYIQKRSQKMDTNPGLWTSSAAGHVTSGQSYLETAKRETQEELGIKIELEEVGTVVVHDPNHNQLIKIFSGLHDGPFDYNKEEIEIGEFLKVGKIKREIRLTTRKFTLAFLEVFRKFCEVKGL